MGLSSVIAAHIANCGAAMGMAMPLSRHLFGILAGVASTVLPGLVNGWLIAYLDVPPFIGTLGMYRRLARRRLSIRGRHDGRHQ